MTAPTNPQLPPLIYAAITKVMSDIGAIGKNRRNQQQQYQFRGIDDVYNAAHEALAKHGVFCVPRVLETAHERGETKSGGAMISVRLRVSYTWYAADGSNIESIMVGEANDTADKATNKAMAAAQKYAFLQMFCIPTEELKDSENDHVEPAASRRPSPQTVQVPAQPTQPTAPAINPDMALVAEGNALVKRMGAIHKDLAIACWWAPAANWADKAKNLRAAAAAMDQTVKVLGGHANDYFNQLVADLTPIDGKPTPGQSEKCESILGMLISVKPTPPATAPAPMASPAAEQPPF